jgi:hypothetical protein
MTEIITGGHTDHEDGVHVLERQPRPALRLRAGVGGGSGRTSREGGLALLGRQGRQVTGTQKRHAVGLAADSAVCAIKRGGRAVVTSLAQLPGQSSADQD